MIHSEKNQLKWNEESRLRELLMHHYGIQVREARKIKRILHLKTDNGDYVLKRSGFHGEQRWKLVQELAEYLQNRGGYQIPAPVLTHRGKLHFSGFQSRYVLLPWVNGKLRDWNRERCWPKVAQTLARFHSDSKGFLPSRSFLQHFSRTGGWKKNWEKAAREIQVFKMAVDMSGEISVMDRFWFKHLPYMEGMVETSLHYLEKAGGDQVVQETRKAGEVCHLNIHRNNVIWDNREEVHFIDWNRVALDVRSRDLSKLILYAYRQTGRPDMACHLLKWYQEVSPLEEEEYALIYAQLLFPSGMMRSLKRVYMDGKASPDLNEKDGWNSVEQEEKKYELLREFPEQVEQLFQKKIRRIDWIQSQK